MTPNSSQSDSIVLPEVYGRVYFVPVIEGTAARREHNLTKLVSIGEMLVFFGNDELCSRRAAPATQKWSFLTIKVLVLPNKGASGSPQQRSHWFTPTKEPPEVAKNTQNTKIFIKRSSVGHFGLVPS